MNSMIIIVLSCTLTCALLYFTLPYLPHAGVNARSAHVKPVPQGAGIVIFLMLFIASFFNGNSAITGIAFGLSLIGFMDDRKGLSVSVRLIAQGWSAALALYILAPSFPLWSVPLIWLGLLWNINLTNFMDGMDGISVLQGLTIAIGVIFARLFGVMPEWAFFLSLYMIACLVGFIPFNKPKAKAFMGDAGALPLGLITGVLLIAYADRAGVIPAIILTLYYAADSGVTLIKRVIRGEKLSEGHKSHFYQQAMQKGMSVYAILGYIALVNMMLIGLSIGAIHAPIVCFITALMLVSALLFKLSNGAGRFYR